MTVTSVPAMHNENTGNPVVLIVDPYICARWTCYVCGVLGKPKAALEAWEQAIATEPKFHAYYCTASTLRGLIVRLGAVSSRTICERTTPGFGEQIELQASPV